MERSTREGEELRRGAGDGEDLSRMFGEMRLRMPLLGAALLQLRRRAVEKS